MSKVGFETLGLKLVSETCGPVALGAKLGSQAAAFASIQAPKQARQSKIVVRDNLMRISNPRRYVPWQPNIDNSSFGSNAAVRVSLPSSSALTSSPE